jgi:hypothetical protein
MIFNGRTSEIRYNTYHSAAVMAQAQKHQDGVALFLLMP